MHYNPVADMCLMRMANGKIVVILTKNEKNRGWRLDVANSFLFFRHLLLFRYWYRHIIYAFQVSSSDLKKKKNGYKHQKTSAPSTLSQSSHQDAKKLKKKERKLNKFTISTFSFGCLLLFVFALVIFFFIGWLVYWADFFFYESHLLFILLFHRFHRTNK